MRVCSIEGCGRKHKGHGYCQFHLWRHRYEQDMLEPNRKSGVNQYITTGDTTTLSLAYKGEKRDCLIDTTDLNLILSVGRRFHAVGINEKLYAHALPKEGNIILMHRLIMGTIGEYTLIDHKDGNGLNNKKDNLRFVDNSINAINRFKPNSNGTSGFLGVTWNKNAERWIAQIRTNGKLQYLGSYTDKLEAAKVVRDFRQEYLDVETKLL